MSQKLTQKQQIKELQEEVAILKDRVRIFKAGEEEGLYSDVMWINLGDVQYNPDEIGIDTYQKMFRTDAQVRSGIDLIRLLVLSKEWHIHHEDEEIADFLTKTLERMRRPGFNHAMHEILSSLWAGFSVTEVVFEQDPNTGLLIVRREHGLKTLPPKSIRFKTDKYANLTGIYQTWDGVTKNDLDLQRCLVYSHDMQFGNYYGESICRAFYKNWFIKDNVLKFANIAYERFGSPILIGIVPRIGDKAKMETSLRGVYARSVGVLVKENPEDTTDVKILESSKAAAPFLEYIDYHNRMIFRRCLIGDKVIGGGGETTGSYAMSKTHFDVLLLMLQDIQSRLCEVIEDLLNRLVSYNFNTDERASFSFEPFSEEDQAALVDMIQKLVEAGTISGTEPWVYERLNIPPPKEETPGDGESVESGIGDREEMTKKRLNLEKATPEEEKLLGLNEDELRFENSYSEEMQGLVQQFRREWEADQ